MKTKYYILTKSEERRLRDQNWLGTRVVLAETVDIKLLKKISNEANAKDIHQASKTAMLKVKEIGGAQKKK